MGKPLEDAVRQIQTLPDSVWGVDLTGIKRAVPDACRRLEVLESEVADLTARLAKLEAGGAAT